MTPLKNFNRHDYAAAVTPEEEKRDWLYFTWQLKDELTYT